MANLMYKHVDICRIHTTNAFYSHPPNLIVLYSGIINLFRFIVYYKVFTIGDGLIIRLITAL